MRGFDDSQSAPFTLPSMEKRTHENHSLRSIRALLAPMFARLDPAFDSLCARSSRPSIPPEQLIRALILQRLYGIPSERGLVEQIDYNP